MGVLKSKLAAFFTLELRIYAVLSQRNILALARFFQYVLF
mgnify:FL=1